MRALNLQADSGTEKSITPEEKWISTQSEWTDEDDSDRERERTPVFQGRGGHVDKEMEDGP